MPSGPIPVAHVPASPWSSYGQTGAQPIPQCQQSGYHQSRDGRFRTRLPAAADSRGSAVAA